jgi:hypothetical protein
LLSRRKTSIGKKQPGGKGDDVIRQRENDSRKDKQYQEEQE